MPITSARNRRPKSAEGEKTQRPNTGEWKPAFLAYLRTNPNVLRAAKAAGIERRMAYKAREQSELFAQDWDEALAEGIDNIEAIAMDNALDPAPSYQTMRIFMLKSWKPERYKETIQNQLTDAEGGKLTINVVYTDADPTDTATNQK